MIIREIVNIPWKVIHGLYWRVDIEVWPGRTNSNLIVFDDPIPVGPPIKPGNRCNAPINIWLVININTVIPNTTSGPSVIEMPIGALLLGHLGRNWTS